MKIPVRKGTFQISFIQCGSWYSSNLLSDGLSIEPGQEGTTPVINFIIDTSVNQKTREKETNSYKDSIELQAKIEDFQYLTISDDKVLSVLASKIKSLPSKVKCVLEITLDKDATTRKFIVQPSISNEVKLTRVGQK
jgi:hypothetical protein